MWRGPADATSSQKKAKPTDPEKMNKKDLLVHAQTLAKECFELKVIYDVINEEVQSDALSSETMQRIITKTKQRAAAIVAAANKVAEDEDEDLLGTPPAGSNNDEASGSADDPHVMTD